MAYADAAYRNMYGVHPFTHFRQRRSAEHMPVIVNGVPMETPEVMAAKAAHAEAHKEAKMMADMVPEDMEMEMKMKMEKMPKMEKMISPMIAPWSAPFIYGKSAVFDHNGYKIDEFTPYTAPWMGMKTISPWIGAKTMTPWNFAAPWGYAKTIAPLSHYSYAF